MKNNQPVFMHPTTSIAKFFFVMVTSFVLGACSDHKAEDKPAPVTSSSAPSTTEEIINIETDKWLGHWNGPEGTFLKISGGKGKYEITISDLDGPRAFNGVQSGNVIHFERNGVKESIHATNGVDTGMKWLSDKTNCLTIKAGEGYCR